MEIKNVKDVETMKINEIIENLIYSPGVFILYGKPKEGKSHFALQLAVEVSNNLGILFSKEKILDKKKSLYISTELACGELKARLEKYYNDLDVNVYDNNNMFLSEYQGNERIEEQIINVIEDHNIQFIVIDMIVDTITSVDINKANEVNNVICQFKNIAKQYNCCFLFVMHANENNNNALSHSQAFRRKPDGVMYLERVTSNKFTLDTRMRNIESKKITFIQNNLRYTIHNKIILNTNKELNEIINFVSSQKDKEFQGSNQDIINKCNIKTINSVQLGFLIKNNIDILNDLGLTITELGKNKSRKLWTYKEPDEDIPF